MGRGDRKHHFILIDFSPAKKNVHGHRRDRFLQQNARLYDTDGRFGT